MNSKRFSEDISHKSDEEIYYHYCSVESFMNIIQSKCIWLTNANFMNDRLENKMIEKHFDLIRETLKPIKSEKYIKHLFENYFQYKNQFYLFCLSKNPDKLSQWRGYAADGKGIAIGFSIRRGAQISKRIPCFGDIDFNQIGCHDILYDKDKQKNKILEICNWDINNEYQISANLSLSLIDLSMIFKNFSFNEEEEVRLMYVQNEKSENKLENISNLKFRYFNNKIIDYYEYSFLEYFDSILIPKIYIGPKCEMTENEICKFLKCHNLINTEIIKSESSYC